MQALVPFLVCYYCVECGRRHFETTADPKMDGAVLEERCGGCCWSHDVDVEEDRDVA